MINNTLDKTVGMLQGLTQKIVNIKSKSEQCLTSENYIELNNKIDMLSAMLNSNSNSNESDIVSLLNLPRAISEYTNDHIGEIISIPYTDESGKILLNSGCIEFEVVGVNHHKDINDESKPTITLMTKYLIRYAAFDAKEPNNPVSHRLEDGNSRWAVANIRQWLNSEEAAGEWFTPQHEYDTAPDTTNITAQDTTNTTYNESGAYADDPGFLVGFSDEIKQHFATVKNKTILCDSDRTALSKDFEETEDKVFLLSRTEIGFADRDPSNPEGSLLAQRFAKEDDTTRQKTGTYYNVYYTRSTFTLGTREMVHASAAGGFINYCIPSMCIYGLAPVIVLC